MIEAVRAYGKAMLTLEEAGVMRVNNPIGDIGEWIANQYYDGELCPGRTVGYDLLASNGDRVQVKTLRDGNQGRRTEAGKVSEPFDLLMLLRLARDLSPVEAVELDHDLVREMYGDGVVRWRKSLSDAPGVRHIPASELTRNLK